MGVLAGCGGAAFLVGGVAVAVVCAADPVGCDATDDVTGVAVLGFLAFSSLASFATKSAISFDMELCASGSRAAGVGFLAGDGEPYIAAHCPFARSDSSTSADKTIFFTTSAWKDRRDAEDCGGGGGGVSFGCFVMSSLLTITVPAPNQSKGNGRNLLDQDHPCPYILHGVYYFKGG